MEYMPILVAFLMLVMIQLVNWRVSLFVARAEEKLKEIEEQLAEIERFIVR